MSHEGPGRRRLAVVLFNLGGPDSPEAVRPFLYNLFKDPAIIGLPALARYPLAALISRTRTKEATANYALMGGRSPLLPETEGQARALEAELLARFPGQESRVFIAMRYWTPLADQTAQAVAAFAPDEIVLLPLYPQYSTTTTGSSVKDWVRAYTGPGRARAVCCYPTLDGVARAHAAKIEAAWSRTGGPLPIRLLFSAHGLPQKVVDGGDPYQAQVEATVAAVRQHLHGALAEAECEICYQSRVGPLKWIGPSTVDAITKAAEDGVGVLLVPVAFVSEHVETLVELDHEYALLAGDLGMDVYLRAPAITLESAFIEGLADMVEDALERPSGAAPGAGWVCPASYRRCGRTVWLDTSGGREEAR